MAANLFVVFIFAIHSGQSISASTLPKKSPTPFLAISAQALVCQQVSRLPIGRIPTRD
jgi:hypothetical protein